MQWGSRLLTFQDQLRRGPGKSCRKMSLMVTGHETGTVIVLFDYLSFYEFLSFNTFQSFLLSIHIEIVTMHPCNP